MGSSICFGPFGTFFWNDQKALDRIRICPIDHDWYCPKLYHGSSILVGRQPTLHILFMEKNYPKVDISFSPYVLLCLILPFIQFTKNWFGLQGGLPHLSYFECNTPIPFGVPLFCYPIHVLPLTSATSKLAETLGGIDHFHHCQHCHPLLVHLCPL